MAVVVGDHEGRSYGIAPAVDPNVYRQSGFTALRAPYIQIEAVFRAVYPAGEYGVELGTGLAEIARLSNAFPGMRFPGSLPA
jgi:hypothetical protein